MSTLIDDFNRAAENPLSDSGAWTNEIVVGDTDLRISGTNNQADGVGNARNTAWRNGGTLGPDLTLDTVIALNGGLNQGVYFFARIANPGTSTVEGYEFFCKRSATSNYTFSTRKYVAGAQTTLDTSGNLAVVAGDKIGVSLVGSLFSFLVNDVAVYTFSDSTFSAAGYVGVGTFGLGSPRIDDYSGDTIISPTIDSGTIVGITTPSSGDIADIADVATLVGITSPSGVDVYTGSAVIYTDVNTIAGASTLIPADLHEYNDVISVRGVTTPSATEFVAKEYNDSGTAIGATVLILSEEKVLYNPLVYGTLKQHWFGIEKNKWVQTANRRVFGVYKGRGDTSWPF